MSKAINFSLYITSYLPLWLSILFLDIMSCIKNQENLLTEKISIIIIFILNAISLFILIYSFKTDSKSKGTEYTLKKAFEDKTITSEYLLSYILPLFVFDFTQWNQIILFLIFFLTLGFLCIRHNHFSINILLEFMGYKLYSCTLQTEDKISFECKILSKRILNSHKGESIFLKSINNEIKLDIKSKLSKNLYV